MTRVTRQEGLGGRSRRMESGRVDYARIHEAALIRLPELLQRWLPDGVLLGREWVARNPTRHDREAGSFRINIDNGRWADFATRDRGGDVVSLAAYLAGISQSEAALRLSRTLGMG